jgi:hypothetical protein
MPQTISGATSEGLCDGSRQANAGRLLYEDRHQHAEDLMGAQSTQRQWLDVLVERPPVRVQQGAGVWVLEMRDDGTVLITDVPVEIRSIDVLKEISELKARIRVMEGR